MKDLTHIDMEGKARMVDVGEKPNQRRVAKAVGHITLASETISLIRKNGMKKGDVLTISEVAGVQAAKRTFELIPLCHNILIDKVTVKAELDGTGVIAEAVSHSTGRTGVEMEALTAVSVALLTVYDMCKAVDKGMAIDSIKLIEKSKYDITG